MLAPLAGLANAYQDALARLSADDPEFVFHANLRNDFNTAGNLLSEFYLAYMQMAPDVPPVPVDFLKVFQRFGLANLDSVTVVSEKSDRGGFLNQSLFLFDGRPGGIFNLTGQDNTPFSILNQAPVDADFLAELNIDGQVLFEIIRGLAVDAMGPLGEGLIEMQMTQPINAEGLTLQDLISRSRTRVQMALQPDYSTEDEPGILAVLKGRGIVRLEGMGDLLAMLAPVLQQSGFVQDGDRLKAEFPIPGMPGALGFILEELPESNDLLLSFSEGSRDWYLSPAQPAIASPDVLTAISGFPDSGLALWYSSERISELQIDRLDSGMPDSEPVTRMLALLKNTLMRFTGPQAGVSFLEQDAYRTLSWQPTSYKTHLALAGIAVPMGIVANLAVQAQQAAEEAEAATADPSGDPVPESAPE